MRRIGVVWILLSIFCGCATQRKQSSQYDAALHTHLNESISHDLSETIQLSSLQTMLQSGQLEFTIKKYDTSFCLDSVNSPVLKEEITGRYFHTTDTRNQSVQESEKVEKKEQVRQEITDTVVQENQYKDVSVRSPLFSYLVWVMLVAAVVGLIIFYRRWRS